MKRLIISVVLVLVIILTGAVACGQSAEEIAEEEGIILSSRDVDTITAPGAAPSPMIDYEDEGSYATSGKSMGGEVFAESADVSQSSGSIDDRMIVRTGNITLVVDDVPTAIEQIKTMAATYEGYVVSSSVWKNDEWLSGSISIRVLAEHFDTALKALRAMAVDVTYENTSSRDVTEEYVDLSATLANLEATEQQFLVILEKAETVEDILNVQKELSDVRGEIERTKARMQYLEETSSTSIIYIQLEQSRLYFEFSANKRWSLKEGEKIEFTVHEIAGGFPPYSYTWDFGDGETSTDANPTHAYKNDGYYSVTLTVTDDMGNTETTIRDSYVYVTPGWSAGSIAGKAWDGLVTFGHVLGNILIWLGIFSPVWIIIGGVIFWRIRRRRQKASQ